MYTKKYSQEITGICPSILLQNQPLRHVDLSPNLLSKQFWKSAKNHSLFSLYITAISFKTCERKKSYLSQTINQGSPGNMSSCEISTHDVLHNLRSDTRSMTSHQIKKNNYSKFCSQIQTMSLLNFRISVKAKIHHKHTERYRERKTEKGKKEKRWVMFLTSDVADTCVQYWQDLCTAILRRLQLHFRFWPQLNISTISTLTTHTVWRNKKTYILFNGVKMMPDKLKNAR